MVLPRSPRRFVAPIAVFFAALAALLTLGAKQASANVCSRIYFQNNTDATLTLVSQSDTATTPNEPGIPQMSIQYDSERWISTDPDGVEAPCAYANAPQTIGPWASGCFYVQADDSGFLNWYNGVGATLTYSIAPASGLPSGVDSLQVAWAWSVPWGTLNDLSLLETNSPWSIGSITEGVPTGGTGTTFGSTVTGITELGFSTPGGTTGNNGSDLINYEFSLDAQSVTATLQGTVGAVGFPINIAGTGFTTGTEVLFNNEPADNVSCSSTLCQATAPLAGSVTTGFVPVTVRSVAGVTASAGSYYYLLHGPQCTYGTAPASGEFTVECAPVAAANTLWVYQQAAVSGGWELVYYGYPRASGSPTESFLQTTPGATATFVACTESTYLPYPGQNGCDEPTTVTMPTETTVRSKLPGGRCLDVVNMSTTDGARVQLYDCWGGSNQEWTWVGDGTIHGIGSNKCLDANGVEGNPAGAPNGTIVQIYDCWGGANQKWSYDGSTGEIRLAGTNKCLDANGQAGTDGELLQIWDCWGGTNQQWTIDD
jgi:hypothetical protein